MVKQLSFGPIFAILLITYSPSPFQAQREISTNLWVNRGRNEDESPFPPKFALVMPFLIRPRLLNLSYPTTLLMANPLVATTTLRLLLQVRRQHQKLHLQSQKMGKRCQSSLLPPNLRIRQSAGSDENLPWNYLALHQIPTEKIKMRPGKPNHRIMTKTWPRQIRPSKNLSRQSNGRKMGACMCSMRRHWDQRKTLICWNLLQFLLFPQKVFWLPQNPKWRHCQWTTFKYRRCCDQSSQRSPSNRWIIQRSSPRTDLSHMRWEPRGQVSNAGTQGSHFRFRYWLFHFGRKNSGWRVCDQKLGWW